MHQSELSVTSEYMFTYFSRGERERGAKFSTYPSSILSLLFPSLPSPMSYPLESEPLTTASLSVSLSVHPSPLSVCLSVCRVSVCSRSSKQIQDPSMSFITISSKDSLVNTSNSFLKNIIEIKKMLLNIHTQSSPCYC